MRRQVYNEGELLRKYRRLCDATADALNNYIFTRDVKDHQHYLEALRIQVAFGREIIGDE